jgi:transposase
LTAAEFAAEAGINPRTLTFWKWRLRRERGRGGRPRTGGFVEVVAATPGGAVVEKAGPASLEVVLRDGTLIRVPPRFDTAALKDVLGALEGR